MMEGDVSILLLLFISSIVLLCVKKKRVEGGGSGSRPKAGNILTPAVLPQNPGVGKVQKEAEQKTDLDSLKDEELKNPLYRKELEGNKFGGTKEHVIIPAVEQKSAMNYSAYSMDIDDRISVSQERRDSGSNERFGASSCPAKQQIQKTSSWGSAEPHVKHEKSLEKATAKKKG